MVKRGTSTTTGEPKPHHAPWRGVSWFDDFSRPSRARLMTATRRWFLPLRVIHHRLISHQASGLKCRKLITPMIHCSKVGSDFGIFKHAF